MRTRVEMADVVRLFGAGLVSQTSLTPLQLRVLGRIASCRTAALGGHEEACENCGTVRYSYNSCGDRHCPKCQAAKQAFWIDELVHLVERLVEDEDAAVRQRAWLFLVEEPTSIQRRWQTRMAEHLQSPEFRATCPQLSAVYARTVSYNFV